eukprot:4440831-Prymnesium_polylepis.1
MRPAHGPARCVRTPRKSVERIPVSVAREHERVCAWCHFVCGAARSAAGASTSPDVVTTPTVAGAVAAFGSTSSSSLVSAIWRSSRAAMSCGDNGFSGVSPSS